MPKGAVTGCTLSKKIVLVSFCYCFVLLLVFNLGWSYLQYTRIAVAFACWNFLIFWVKNNEKFQEANATVTL